MEMRNIHVYLFLERANVAYCIIKKLNILAKKNCP